MIGLAKNYLNGKNKTESIGDWLIISPLHDPFKFSFYVHFTKLDHKPLLFANDVYSAMV